MEPDGYCRYGNPYWTGFFGIGTHDCDECRQKINPNDLLAIMRQCFLDHEKIPTTSLTARFHCDDCETEEVHYEGWTEDDGTIYEPWTDVRVFHRISPEQISLIGIVTLPEENEWGHDVIAEFCYTNGTEWQYHALYGFSASTGVASCYAD
jgi:hypothetical protein